jgi:toxin ParE1/3/4
MPLQYVLSPMAEEDLEDIWTYTAREWSVDQAETYTNDIINMFEDIAAGTRDGRPVLVRAGYLKRLVGRHAIYFQARGGVIVIIRILHQSMDVERHL